MAAVVRSPCKGSMHYTTCVCLTLHGKGLAMKVVSCSWQECACNLCSCPEVHLSSDAHRAQASAAWTMCYSCQEASPPAGAQR